MGKTKTHKKTTQPRYMSAPYLNGGGRLRPFSWRKATPHVVNQRLATEQCKPIGAGSSPDVVSHVPSRSTRSLAPSSRFAQSAGPPNSALYGLSLYLRGPSQAIE